ncbi:MAG: SEL1-like repeat protein [Opitutales bacterium]|nr:SEL1-like repeat protein [Opitutales bacterium]MBT5814982.1 SEL1-like repeat protein [Opitutales bacterium]MBT6768092.1 SEL1-like repeat protein [Opitutales bacterium]MBT7865268.1 SEL1-like repeat protein [Opitutales bacterium]
MAEEGYALAQFNLGVSYDNGEGVLQDDAKAHMWLNLAAANGIDVGSKARDLVAKEMTSEQIAEAQKMAREWMEEHEKD